jgi:hypothetical protein
MLKLDRVQQEIANDRLWKARERMLGLLSTYRTSQEVFELLGRNFIKGEAYLRLDDIGVWQNVIGKMQ